MPPAPRSASPDPGRGAYVSALRLLARRELSEAQVRARLGQRGFDADSIEAAVGRLRAERALDDRRVALAGARTASQIKRRGRARVLRDIEALGIAREVARQAVDEVFGALNEDALLEAALSRRLPGGRSRIASPAEFGRLYRYLLGQGFDPSKIVALLRARSKAGAVPDDDG